MLFRAPSMSEMDRAVPQVQWCDEMSAARRTCDCMEEV